jgi:hypothetical protein
MEAESMAEILARVRQERLEQFVERMMDPVETARVEREREERAARVAKDPELGQGMLVREDGAELRRKLQEAREQAVHIGSNAARLAAASFDTYFKAHGIDTGLAQAVGHVVDASDAVDKIAPADLWMTQARLIVADIQEAVRPKTVQESAEAELAQQQREDEQRRLEERLRREAERMRVAQGAQSQSMKRSR